MNRLSLLLLLIVSVGCFTAKPKRVAGPNQKISGAGDVQPKLASTIKEFSWSIQGESPLAAWSPDLKRLAISADNPAKTGEKFIHIFDLTNGGTLTKTLIKGSIEFPEWLNDEMLGFVCPYELCGPGRSGVYILTTEGETKMILPLDVDSIAHFYPASDRIILVVSTNQHNGENPRAKIYQFEPSAWRVYLLGASPFQSGGIPNSLQRNNCSIYDGSLFAYSDHGRMIVSDMETSTQQIIAEATPMPKYLGDDMGVSPCISRDLQQAIYYSYDPGLNTGRANLIPYQPPAR